MTSKLAILALTIILCSFCALSSNLSLEANIPRIGDSMERELIAMSSIKHNSSWNILDLSKAKLDGTYKLEYTSPTRSDSTSIMVLITDRRNITNLTSKDFGLWATSETKPGIIQQYTKPMPEFIATGDTAASYYCYGRIGTMSNINIHGKWNTTTNKATTIITPKCDTLLNVLCFTLETEGMMSSDSGKNNNIHKGMLRRWYQDGYRYPILEMSEHTICSSDSIIDYDCKLSYLSDMAQESQIADDPINESIRESISSKAGSKLPYTSPKSAPKNFYSTLGEIASSYADIKWDEKESIASATITSSEKSKCIITLSDSSGKTDLINNYEIQGQEILQFDLSAYPAGVYIISIASRNGNHTSKIRKL